MFLKYLQNLHENICAGISQSCRPLKRDSRAGVFSCKLCKNFKNTYFVEHLTVSEDWKPVGTRNSENENISGCHFCTHVPLSIAEKGSGFLLLIFDFPFVIHVSVIRKQLFRLSLNFLNIMLEICLRFSSYIFLTVIASFSIVYLVRFNLNNKRHLLTHTLTRVSISTFPRFNLSMFT